MNSRLKKLKWNSTLALAYQAILILTGFLLPRCFLKFYGSEVYGLASSITQFLSFINLCDMGVSAVVSSAMYQPLADGDGKRLSAIVKYAKKFFRIISYILIVYVIALLLIYPRIVKDQFSAVFTITLILAMCISQFGQYFLGITYQILLNADQKSYVQLLINGGTLIANTIMAILVMYMGGSIQLVKLLTSAIYLLRPILLYRYVKRHYAIDETVEADGKVIPQKWSGVIQHISYTIYENTDIVVLTLFSALSDVSIYAVYTLATNGIKTIINASTTGVQALFGNMIAKKEQEELGKAYDFYEWAVHAGSVLLFTLCGKLIVPFALIYTRGIEDANYNVPLFAIFITLAYGVNTIRNSMYVVIRAAGHYKKTQTASMVEAIMNLVISILFVFRFGLVGVAIGTLCATAFYTIYEVLYFSKEILLRPIGKFIKQVGVDALSVGLMLGSTCFLEVPQLNYGSWFVTALLAGAICFLETLLVQLFFYRGNMLILWERFYHKKSIHVDK